MGPVRDPNAHPHLGSPTIMLTLHAAQGENTNFKNTSTWLK